MNPESWQEVLRLFADARALSPSERAAFLERECRQTEVRAEVEALLAAQAPETFLEPPPLDEPSAGRDLGDFTLLEEVGRGGMGVVYRAVQRPLQRIVAVKVLPGSFALTPRQVDRFQREARAAARLTHPNLVSVLTVGEERGVRFFAMEYVEGRNLAQELERLRADLGAAKDERAHLPSSRAADYFRSVAETIRQAADGLAHAHEHGVIHRDVKPSNLLLDPSGRVKVADFGLARDEELGSASGSRDVLGTPHYMSPEQARALHDRIDQRTDVYSLGVVLYELLTLQRPFEGRTSQEVIDNVIAREPARIRKLNPRVPRDLETICDKAMAKEPRDRYADAGAFRDDLARFLSHQAPLGRGPGAWRRIQRQLRRHRVSIGAVALLAAGIGLGNAWTVRAADAPATKDRLDRITDLDFTRDWSDLGTQGLVEGRRALASLDVEAVPEQQEPRRRVAARYDELHASWLKEAERLIEEGKGGVDDEDLLRGLQLAARGQQVFSDDPAFSALFDRLFDSELSIEATDAAGRPLEGVVRYRRLDLVTGLAGDLVELGPLPIHRPIPSGFYRFVVRTGNDPPREFTRLAAPGQRAVSVVCAPLDGRDPLEGMVRVPGGTLRIPPDDAFEQCPFRYASPEIAPFWIDATEVSVGRYRRFLAATGRPPPDEWRFLAGGAPPDDLPVTGVTWFDAEAYAEWCGKRLVSHAEWELAARGPDGALFPYALAPGESGYRGTVHARVDPTSTDEDAIRQYAASASPVDSPAEARGRNGLYHMLGNVWEWTESLGLDRDDAGRWTPQYASRVLLGGDWSSAARGWDLKTHRLWNASPRYSNAGHGFRCARSDDP